MNKANKLTIWYEVADSKWYYDLRFEGKDGIAATGGCLGKMEGFQAETRPTPKQARVLADRVRLKHHQIDIPTGIAIVHGVL